MITMTWTVVWATAASSAETDHLLVVADHPPRLPLD